MIRVRDATMLALTKLRTRKVRLVITIVISGLLFSVLAGASFITRGVIQGAGDFSKEGLGSRYIAQGSTQSNFGFANSQDVINRAEELQKELIAQKKAAAKALNIDYEPATEAPATQSYDTPGGKQTNLNDQSRVARQAIREYITNHPQPGLTDLKKEAAPYHAKAFFSSQQVPYDLGGAQLQVLKKGQETYTASGGNKNYGPPTGTDSFISSWAAMSSGLIQPFLFPGQNLQTGKDGSIPIVIPRSAAGQILGLKVLPQSASDKDRLARTKEIRDKAPNVRFTVCYRNRTSSDLLSQAISTQQQIEQNKDNKNYQKPDLIYGLPTQACGAVPIIRDVRSADDKNLAAKQEQFDEQFGKEPEQEQTLTFRIVGVVADPDYSTAIGAGQILRSLLGSTLGSGWFMPADQLASNALIHNLFTQSIYVNAALYVEFPTASDGRSFIDKENCDLDYSKLAPDQDPESVCVAQKKPFIFGPYGSNSLALESASRNFAKIFRIAALAVSIVAAIIMMGTVGRMVADSRRETAVFRAIGARRFDIAQIYLIYAICLALLIAGFAIAIGFIVAVVANARWGSQITVQALSAFNVSDLNKTISLYRFYAPDILLLIGLSLAAGLLSAVFPLLRNLRRNPIRDMRDDT